MSGMLEDLRDKVSDLETALVKLCRRAGHDEWESVYPGCLRHPRRLSATGAATGEQCATCKTFRCCEEEEAKSS